MTTKKYNDQTVVNSPITPSTRALKVDGGTIVEKDGGTAAGLDSISDIGGNEVRLIKIQYITLDKNGNEVVTQEQSVVSSGSSGFAQFQTEYGTILLYDIVGDETVLIDYKYRYTLDDRNSNDKVLHLDEGQKQEEIFRFIVETVHGDEIEPTDLVLTIEGSNDAPEIDHDATMDTIVDDDELDEVTANDNAVNILENRDGMSASGKIIGSDENEYDNDQYPDSLTYSFADGTTVFTSAYGTITLDPITGEWEFTGNPLAPVYATLKEGDAVSFPVTFVVTDSFGETAEETIEFEITGVDYGYDLNAVHEYAPSDILAWIERDGKEADPDGIVGDAKISDLEAYGDWQQSSSLSDLIITQPLDTFGFDSSKEFWILTKDAGNGEKYQVIIDEDGRSFYTGDKDLGTNEEIIPVEFKAKVTGQDVDGNEIVKEVDSTIITGSDTYNLEQPVADFISDGSIQEESLVDYAAYTGKDGEVSNTQNSNGYSTNRDNTVIEHDIGATNGGRTYVEFNGFQDIELIGDIYADSNGSFLGITVDTPNRGDSNRDNDSAFYENNVTIGDITVEEGAAGTDIKVVAGSKDYNYKSKSDFNTGDWEIGGKANNIDFIGRSEGTAYSSLCGMSSSYADYSIGRMTFNGDGESDVNILTHKGDYVAPAKSKNGMFIPIIRGYIDDITAEADAIVDYHATGLLGDSNRLLTTKAGQKYFWDFNNVTATEDSVLNFQASLINIGDMHNTSSCSSKSYNTIRIDSLNAKDDSEINVDIAGVSVGNITSDYKTSFQGSMGTSIDSINSDEYATLNFNFAHDATGDFMATGKQAIKSTNLDGQGMFFNFNDLAGESNINIHGVNGGDSNSLAVQDTRLIAIGYTSSSDEGKTKISSSRYYDMDDQGMVVTGDLNMNIYGASGGTATNLQKMYYADKVQTESDGYVSAYYHVKFGHVDLTDISSGGINVYGIADKVVDSTIDDTSGQTTYVNIEGSLKTSSHEDFVYHGIAREMAGTNTTQYSKFELEASQAEGGLTAYGYAETYTGGTFIDRGTVEIKTGSGDDLIYTMFDFTDTVSFEYVDYFGTQTVDAGAGNDRVMAGLGTSGRTTYDGGDGSDLLILVGSLSDYAALEGYRGQDIVNFTSNGENYGVRHTFSAYDFETISFTDDANELALINDVWTIA